LTGTPPLVLTFEAEKTVLPERVMRSAILERYARPGPEAVARHVARIRRAAGGRDCCWHHGINWHLVSETAIAIALQAQASGTSPEDAFDALDLAGCGLAGDDRDGLILLL
jgi:hypothetical protein